MGLALPRASLGAAPPHPPNSLLPEARAIVPDAFPSPPSPASLLRRWSRRRGRSTHVYIGLRVVVMAPLAAQAAVDGGVAVTPV